MKTTIILGAGATFGALPVNHDFPPPLLQNLPEIITEKFLSLNRSKDGPSFAEGFCRLLDLTDTRKDIEKYLTILHILGLISRRINKKYVFLSNAEIDNLINNQLLRDFFVEEALIRKATCILEFFRDNKRYSLLNYPANFQNLFQNSIREYFFHSLKNCFCDRHRMLFDELNRYDVVVNFNYDEVADFTLFSTNRLNRESFRNLPFADIVFPRPPKEDCEPICYLKVHGSFNWWTEIEDQSKVYYCLISEASSSQISHLGNTFFPIVLPTLTKKIIYKQYPIYEAHIRGLVSHLQYSNKVVLVGKSFKNSDRELNELIYKACQSKSRDLTIIDPCISEVSFISHHESLFNGICKRKFKSFEEYGQHQSA